MHEYQERNAKIMLRLSPDNFLKIYQYFFIFLFQTLALSYCQFRKLSGNDVSSGFNNAFVFWQIGMSF